MAALVSLILWLSAVVLVAQLYHLEREYQVLFGIYYGLEAYFWTLAKLLNG
jgi:hypothetical protein